MFATFLLQKPHLPPQIPLFYSKQLGEDQLGEWWMIFVIPAIINVFYFINRFVYKKFFLKNEFISNVLTVVNCFVIIFCTMIFIKILLLVTI